MMSFESLLRRAEILRRLDPEPLHDSWWTGYLRGLRRAHHGVAFGTEEEHQFHLAATNSPDPSRAALGRGYRAGLARSEQEPD